MADAGSSTEHLDVSLLSRGGLIGDTMFYGLRYAVSGSCRD